MEYKFIEDLRPKEAERDPYVYPEYEPDPHLKVLEQILDCLRDIQSILRRREGLPDRRGGGGGGGE